MYELFGPNSSSRRPDLPSPPLCTTNNSPETVLTPSLLLKIISLSGWSPETLQSLSLASSNLTNLGYYPTPTSRITSGFVSMPSLVALNLSNNALTSLSGLNPSLLPNLQNLSLSFNRIPKVPTSVLSNLTSLEVLDSKGNPMCELSNYRFTVLSASSSVRVLDGRTVTGKERRGVGGGKENKVERWGEGIKGRIKMVEEEYSSEEEEEEMEVVDEEEVQGGGGSDSGEESEVELGADAIEVMEERGGETDEDDREVMHSLVLGNKSVKNITEVVGGRVEEAVDKQFEGLKGEIEESLRGAVEGMGEEVKRGLRRDIEGWGERVEEGIGGRLEVRFKGLEEEIKGIVEGVKRKLEDVRITRDGGCQTEGEFRDEEEARREVERMEREAILGDNEGLRKAINTVVADNEVVKKYNEDLRRRVVELEGQLGRERKNREKEIEVWKGNFRRMLREAGRIMELDGGDKGGAKRKILKGLADGFK